MNATAWMSKALSSALVAVLVAGCGPKPLLPPLPSSTIAITEGALVGRPGEDLLALGEDDFRFVADRLEARRRSTTSRVRDARLEAALRELGCRLAPERCPRLRAVVYDAVHPVLRVWPTDLIDLSTGMLLRTTSDTELAALLAHELAHDGLRHRALVWEAVQRAAIPEIMRSNTVDPPIRVGGHAPDAVPTFVADYEPPGVQEAVGTVLMATVLLAVIAGGRAPSDRLLMGFEPMFGTSSPIAFDAANEVAQLGFLPSLEAAADEEAARRLANAGFDPSVADRVWERLRREPDPAGPIPYLRPFREIHPLEGERRSPSAAIRGPARQVPASESWRRLVLAERPARLAAEIEAGSWNRALHLIEAWRAVDPEAADLLWARGETLRRRDEPGDRAAALADLERAARDPRAPVATFRSLGLLLDREGRPAEAAEAYRTYLARSPRAPDRSLIEGRLSRGRWSLGEPVATPADADTVPIATYDRPWSSYQLTMEMSSMPMRYGWVWTRRRKQGDVPRGAGIDRLASVQGLADGERLAPEHDFLDAGPRPTYPIRLIFPVALPHVFRASMNELELVDLFTTLFTAAGAWRAELVSVESVEIGAPGVRAEWRLIEPELGTDERARVIFATARNRLFAAIYRADAAGAWAAWLTDAEGMLNSFKITLEPTILDRALYRMLGH
ncbi:MAG: hypothetical protein NZ555_05595 [Geminicoccaceae bacterium]|nr:hypothetical protein [Geminicoccaceae bacterium]